MIAWPQHRRIQWPIYLILAWVVLTALFWVLNPSATGGLGRTQRLVFWAAHIGIPLALLQVSQSVLSKVPSVTRLPGLAQVALGGIAGGLVFLPAAALLDRIFPDADDTAAEPFLSVLLSEFWSILPAVVLVWIAVNAPRLLQSESPASSPERPPKPGFWQKVPAALGDDLVSLSAELHYTRVRTTAGETLVLYPFGKAVEELTETEGLQVHRSHWLAFAHVAQVLRRREQAVVTMDTGDTVPVSRRFRADLFAGLEAAGATRVIRA